MNKSLFVKNVKNHLDFFKEDIIVVVVDKYFVMNV